MFNLFPLPDLISRIVLEGSRLILPIQSFCKKDLPAQCRVIEPGMMVTKDFQPERLNVHLKEDGTVSHVQHG